MTAALVAIFVGILLVCLFDWRKGLLLCIAVGFLQDPVRKILPGRPVLLTVAVAVCFVACLAGMYLGGSRLPFTRLLRWFPRAKPAVVAFVTIVLVQCVVTLVRTRNPVLSGLGLLAYFSPPLALLLGERYAESFAHIRRWTGVYLAGAAALAVSILLEFAGVQSPLFAAIGIEYVYGIGGAIRMMSGLMRSSEIAAWHAAAGACLLAVLGFAGTRAWRRNLAFAGSAFLIVAVFLTGRRKMLAEIVLFAVIYAALVLQYRRGGSRKLQALLVLVLMFVVGAQLFGGAEGSGTLIPYLARGVSAFGDASGRLRGMTIDQFVLVVQQNGILGSGAGTGAQGSQYFGGGMDIVGGQAEGGLSKVLAELGVPGLLALLWLAAAVGRALIRVARLARRRAPGEALVVYGLIAFLPANAAVFLTAHQVYGDPFVLIVLGWITGSILAFPRLWAEASLAAAARDRWTSPVRSARPVAA